MADKTFTPRVVSTEIFGDLSRFKLTELVTRFGTTTWMVDDAEVAGPDGLPETVIQEDSRKAAVAKALLIVADRCPGGR
jgi:hypothetical protein